LFRDTSEAETGHAFGHLDFLNLPNGSRHSRRPSGPMRIASRRGSTA
jgi:hypothetical protein